MSACAVTTSLWSVHQLQAGAGGGKYVMRDLMRVLEHEKHAYTDPVTEVRFFFFSQVI